MHGGAGVSQDTFLAYAYGLMRTLRLADGPDEVHLMTMKSTDLRVVLTALLEAFFLVGVTAFQIFVIRRMFDRKVANVLR